MQQQVTDAPIPLVDLKAQYRTIQPDIDAAVQRVIARGDFILGADVAAFEAEFAAYCGVAHAIGCGSGTEALHLGLEALGIGAGDEVIMPAMTFVATALAINQCGAKPVLYGALVFETVCATVAFVAASRATGGPEAS